MNAYKVLCILYKLIKEEDRANLMAYAESSSHFEGMSFQTVLEGCYREAILAEELTSAQQLLIYSYGYLYYTLKSAPFLADYEAKWGSYFKLSEKQKGFIKARFTKERKDYLYQFCKKNNKSALEMILEPDAFIESFMKKGVILGLQMQPEEAKHKSTANKLILTQLKLEEYEHPDDRKLTDNLRGNKILEVPVKLFVEYDIERFVTVQYTGSNIKVTPNNLPMIYKAVKMACDILDVPKMPDIYIQQGLEVNACTTGVEHPILILNAGCVSLLDFEELLFVVGHEIGHIKSQHLLYQMISQTFPYIAEIAAQMTLGIAGLVGTGVQLLLYNWQRKSELTADRAGLLVCQNKSAAIRALMKCAGYPPKFYDTINEEEFLKQADAFESLDEADFNKIVKVISVITKSHPWTVERAKELNKWYSDGQYNQVISRQAASR